MRTKWVAFGAVVAAAALGIAEHEARACGGCFHPPPPPNEDPSMVTAHRMILSVSSKQTTLYDQIKYSGNPKEFAWVLPISGIATVGLSSDLVFATLGSLTETQISAPPMNCPQMPSDCYQRGGMAAAPEDNAGASAADAGVSGPVTVTKEETVGPYETVQLHASDPQALNTWLAGHGYLVPPDVQPIIGAYVSEHFDFLAMKLAPGQGVSSMRPVRVSTAGASPVLPLRMVAAGTGATVGITLWVVGEGRYEPQNFPSFAIAAQDLVWDWTTNASNFAQLRADKEASSQNRAWEIESSINLSQSAITRTVTYANYPQYDAGSDYLGTDGGSGAPETPTQVRQDDLDTLFSGMSGDAVRVTRLRSDLAHAALASDLVLQAAADQSLLPVLRQVTKEANEPTCPIYQGCDVVGQGPRSEAQQASGSARAESFSCRAAARGDGMQGALAALAGIAGIVVVRSRRRRQGGSRA